LGQVSGKAGLAEAIHYALHYWQRLVLFLEDGRLELDTNTLHPSGPTSSTSSADPQGGP
jgi:transposase